MEQSTGQLKNDVMKRIERAYMWRTHARPIVLECVALGALAGGSAFFVSLNSVFFNAMHSGSVSSFSNFVYHAFKGTDLSVKVLSVAGVIVVSYIAKDACKSAAAVYRGVFA